MSCDAITGSLLAERGVDINFIGGHGEFQIPSTSLHHTVARTDTVLLQRLLTEPGIYLKGWAGGQSPFSVPCAHGRLDEMVVLLNTGSVGINVGGLGDPPICPVVERGHLEAVRLFVQQGGHLQISRGMMTAHNTVLCTAAQDENSEMVRALLRTGEIDPNVENRWFQALLSVASKGAHLLAIDALLADRRLSLCSIVAAVNFATSASVGREAIRSKIIHGLGAHQESKLARSPRQKISAFFFMANINRVKRCQSPSMRLEGGHC
ncbi:hypothetical protein PITC_024280 [Penicillium italicum]|uniref:Uncharacterized protein n=1 Tax=Penicillium italicum TaxID=40296 RepID=A0A0A2LDD8_PENIT|nr:hypothetical protein PITC_024280 [Penicillium italicum]